MFVVLSPKHTVFFYMPESDWMVTVKFYHAVHSFVSFNIHFVISPIFSGFFLWFVTWLSMKMTILLKFKNI